MAEIDVKEMTMDELTQTLDERDTKLSLSISEEIKKYLDQLAKPKEEDADKIKKVANDIHNIEVGENRLAYDPQGGYKCISEFLTDVYKAANTAKPIPQKLAEWNQVETKTTGVVEEGSDAQIGFLIPPEHGTRIFQRSLDAGVIRAKTQPVPMQKNSIDFPAYSDASRSSSLFGGIVTYWLAEKGQITASNQKMRQIRLTLHKLAALVHATSELLEDSPISLEPLFNDMFGQAIAFEEDEVFISGTGAGKPLGVLNAACKIAVSAETGQLATEVVYANIINMYARMSPMSINKAEWFINQNVLTQLFKLAIPIGTGGTAAFIMPGGLPNAPSGTLLGRPVNITEHCKTLGTEGDIIFGDFSQYLVGGKPGQDIQTASSMHLRFDYDETSFRVTRRMDGQPWWDSALQPKNGSTVSPFITLATRS